MAWKLAAGLLLVVLQLALLRGFTNHLDLHPSDGVLYVRNGLLLLRGEPPANLLAWGPVLAVGYAGLHAAGVAVEHLHDVMTALVAVGSTLGLFWLLAGACGARPALLLAALWASGPVVLNPSDSWAPPPTYLLAAALAWSALGFVLRGRHRLAVVLFALAALERGEVALVLLLGSAAWWWLAPARRGRRAALAVFAVAAALFALHQLHGPARDRTWLAFRQHYAGAMAMREQRTDGYDEPAGDALIARDFPGATSPLSAAASNPGAVLAHAMHSALALPDAVAALCLTPFAHAPPWRWGCLCLVGAALGVVLLRGRGRRRLSRLLRGRRVLLGALAAGGAGSLATVLLLWARPVLLWPLVPLLTVPVGLALSALPLRRRVGPWPAFGLVAAFAALAPRPFGDDVVGLREVRATLHLLQRHEFAPTDVLCAEHAKLLLALVGGARGVRPVSWSELRAGKETAAGCAAAFAQARPDLLVVGPSTLAAGGLLAPALTQELDSDRWEIDDYYFPVLLYRRVP